MFRPLIDGLGNVDLGERIGARKLVLFFEPIEDPLRRMPLLAGPMLVIFQNGVDHGLPRPQLGPLDRLLPLVTGWHSVPQFVPRRISRQPKLLGHRSLTETSSSIAFFVNKGNINAQ